MDSVQKRPKDMVLIAIIYKTYCEKQNVYEIELIHNLMFDRLDFKIIFFTGIAHRRNQTRQSVRCLQMIENNHKKRIVSYLFIQKSMNYTIIPHTRYFKIPRNLIINIVLFIVH